MGASPAACRLTYKHARARCSEDGTSTAAPPAEAPTVTQSHTHTHTSTHTHVSQPQATPLTWLQGMSASHQISSTHGIINNTI